MSTWSMKLVKLVDLFGWLNSVDQDVVDLCLNGRNQGHEERLIRAAGISELLPSVEESGLRKSKTVAEFVNVFQEIRRLHVESAAIPMGDSSVEVCLFGPAPTQLASSPEGCVALGTHGILNAFQFLRTNPEVFRHKPEAPQIIKGLHRSALFIKSGCRFIERHDADKKRIEQEVERIIAEAVALNLDHDDSTGDLLFHSSTFAGEPRGIPAALEDLERRSERALSGLLHFTTHGFSRHGDREQKGADESVTVVSVDMCDYSRISASVHAIEDIMEAAHRLQSILEYAAKSVELTEQLQFDLSGDGALIYFKDTNVAVEYASSILRESNHLAIEGSANRPSFRIGIASGEVGSTESEISNRYSFGFSGDAIVASIRLESACPLGKIVVAEGSWNALTPKNQRLFGGVVQLKGQKLLEDPSQPLVARVNR